MSFARVGSLGALAMIISGSALQAAPLSPLVDLNTDSTSNFVLTSTDTRVQVWFDSSSVGGSQNFGQNTANNRPGWLASQAMPNGINRNLVNFAGGTATRGSGTDASSIDFLTSGSWNGSAFTDGPDTNYIMPAISWFSVIRVSANLTTRQDYLWTAYGYTQQGGSDPNTSFDPVSGTWGSRLIDSADVGTNVNFEADASGTVVGGATVGPDAALDTWYIVGNVWDPVVQTLRMKILTPNTLTSSTVLFSGTEANLSPALTNGGYAMSSATTHHVRLGAPAGSVASNATREFNGQMAEQLIYDSALSSTDFDAVMNYLDQKFFLEPVPEPSTLALACAGGVGFTVVAVRRKKRAS